MRKIAAFCVTAAAFFVTSSAFAYTPQWLECTGELTLTKGGATTKQPATDIYVYDPDARHLFKYFESDQRLAFLSAQSTSDQILEWGSTRAEIGRIEMAGKFDVSKMSLNLSYKANQELRVWNQSCKPTNPRSAS